MAPKNLFSGYYSLHFKALSNFSCFALWIRGSNLRARPLGLFIVITAAIILIMGGWSNTDTFYGKFRHILAKPGLV